MKKFLMFFSFVFFSSFAVAAPVPSGKGKISYALPSQVSITLPAYYNSQNIKAPFPTNKWFNSTIYACYDFNPGNVNAYSFRMYTFPQVFRCQDAGMLILYPKTKYTPDIVNYGSGETTADANANTMVIAASTSLSNGTTINFPFAQLDSYSDFSATMKWEKNSNYMKSTIGQGFTFSYFEFSNNVYPSIDFPYNWNEENYWHDSTPGYSLYYSDGNLISQSVLQSNATDSFILRVHLADKDVYYGVFVPAGTIASQDTRNINTSGWYVPWIRIAFTMPQNNKYMSVALLPSANLTEAKEDIKKYYKYAYNFVDKTSVEWNVKSNSKETSAQTEFKITTKKKRTDISQNEGTIFCLFPHQYNNILSEPSSYGKMFEDTLRGNLKIYSGSTFSTEVKFNGIVPFFQYNISNEAKNIILNSLDKDKNININDVSEKNTYYYGKNLAKIANLIPVADNLGKDVTKRLLIAKLKTELATWFTYSGQTNKYFAYDSTWGGLIGIGDPNVFITGNSFGTEKYNDHNFHYGYYIYAAAILSMYDEEFLNNYGSMVELLIKDFANTDRNDKNFTYMRSFDFYESHSWANGMGGADDRGIDIESSSEAMNAWAAIYMWGLASQKQQYIDLGIYLYTNEYEAIKNYFFDTGEEKNILKNAYSHISLGILFAGSASYNELWWKDWVKYGARQYQGIQLLPMTASMLYVGYDSTYAQSFYNEDNYAWNDIWTRFLSIFNNNASTAWNIFFNNHTGQDYIDDGGTASYTYHFIDFFRQNGSLQIGYSSNIPSYLVTKKDDNTLVFSAYNNTDTVKKVDFYKGSTYLGYMNVYAKSFMSTSNLINSKDETKISVFPVPYKPNTGSRYDAEGITFLGIQNGANIKIFNVAGEKVFDRTISTDEGLFIWNAKNDSGNNVASGIYIYIVDSGGKKTKGKLAIER